MNTTEQKTQTTSQSSELETVQLSAEDRARMARLYEEVSGRLQEMGLIMARNLGMDTSKGVVAKFSPAKRQGEGLTPNATTQGIVIVCNEDETSCGCHDYDNGTCGPCPW